MIPKKFYHYEAGCWVCKDRFRPQQGKLIGQNDDDELIKGKLLSKGIAIVQSDCGDRPTVTSI